MQWSADTVRSIETLTARRLARSTGRAATQSDLIRAVQVVLESAQSSGQNAPRFSLSKMVRGMSAMKSRTINPATVEEDVNYVKSLQTGQTPGSYVIPTIQSDRIVELLSFGAVARSAGATVWPMDGVQRMTVPVSLTSPSFVFTGQNSRQSPDSAASLGQMTFDLIEHNALLALSSQLFKVSVPAFDDLLEGFFALGCGESEDAAMFASSTQANSPLALMSQAGINVVNAANNNANGGNLAYGDLTGLLEKSAEAKVRPPLAWFCSPRTFGRILSLASTTASR